VIKRYEERVREKLINGMEENGRSRRRRD